MARFKDEILNVSVDTIESATGQKLQDVISDLVITVKPECEKGERCGMFATVEGYSYEEEISYGIAGWGNGPMSREMQERYSDSETVYATKIVTGCTNSSCSAEFCALNSLNKTLSALGPRSIDALRRAEDAAQATTQEFTHRRAEIERARTELEAEAVAAKTSARTAVIEAFREELVATIVDQNV